MRLLLIGYGRDPYLLIEWNYIGNGPSRKGKSLDPIEVTTPGSFYAATVYEDSVALHMGDAHLPAQPWGDAFRAMAFFGFPEAFQHSIELIYDERNPS